MIAKTLAPIIDEAKTQNALSVMNCIFRPFFVPVLMKTIVPTINAIVMNSQSECIVKYFVCNIIGNIFVRLKIRDRKNDR